MQRNIENGLIQAGLATAGAAGGRQQRKLFRSERARSRAFNAEAKRVQKAFERQYGCIGEIPDTLTTMRARAASDPVFAILSREIERLLNKWL